MSETAEQIDALREASSDVSYAAELIAEQIIGDEKNPSFRSLLDALDAWAKSTLKAAEYEDFFYSLSEQVEELVRNTIDEVATQRARST